jgi:hypothetical protein
MTKIFAAVCILEEYKTHKRRRKNIFVWRVNKNIARLNKASHHTKMERS